jgi:hypothetical protein
VNVKPADCRCDFPEVLARNLTGHGPDCPAHERLMAEIRGRMGWEPEDRGRPLYVWAVPAAARFEPFAGAEELLTISVPIGWTLAADPVAGIVLRHTVGRTMTALEARGAAKEGRDGFRVRE